MSSIAAVSQTPPSIPVAPVKPVDNDKPGVASAPDHDGDKDDGAAASVSAAKPPGQGKIVDIKA
ncbi:MAG TPA: hypothetical protein VHN39_06955 [Phenylobacterium sp.]|jgi:hypothetical protein|nr:hypothetical protein [Phenylobacterium sp.]HMC95135.1 hypothetical protein [Polyangia bacterium]